jgi:hypothetical protein
MKKTLLIFAVCLLSTFAAKAQYNKAIGLRGGFSSGITFKAALGNNAFELIGATRYSGLNITALYEINNKLADIEGLYWFYGFGAHIGFWDDNNPWFDEEGSYTVIGVDGIIGIEYVFDAIPLCISLDYKPAFNLTGYSGFWGDNGALSVRYTF